MQYFIIFLGKFILADTTRKFTKRYSLLINNVNIWNPVFVKLLHFSWVWTFGIIPNIRAYSCITRWPRCDRTLNSVPKIYLQIKTCFASPAVVMVHHLGSYLVSNLVSVTWGFTNVKWSFLDVVKTGYKTPYRNVH